MATGQDWNRLNWQRLASHVISFRQLAGYPTPRALADVTEPRKEMSYKTLLRIERAAQPVSPNTLGILERYLHWKPGSAVTVLHGGEPELEGIDAKEAESAAIRREILAMTPEERTATYRRIRAVLGPEEAEKWRQRVIELIADADEEPLSSPQQTDDEVG
ncbi:hypothetical protein ACFORH_43025 [Amycolatopsis roodepoortensis]|uniref:XRE family transcriptional regulator n=1 Tax=Amycolatopsis roodepoortensis TaxID=700274 RepID=A0ABR9L429_9PSEU|nr:MULTISPECIES: hypothetical protein [Amycolatopsis]MBE1575020.1 hypothetical protein [Amycolatopsis roodepoortensis]GHG97463.1 hypothetical protein GCM10017788_76980 [Amycolatopsis acidiphila]